MHDGGCPESTHLSAPGGSHWLLWDKGYAREPTRIVLSRFMSPVTALIVARAAVEGDVTACERCYGGTKGRLP